MKSHFVSHATSISRSTPLLSEPEDAQQEDMEALPEYENAPTNAEDIQLPKTPTSERSHSCSLLVASNFPPHSLTTLSRRRGVF